MFSAILDTCVLWPSLQRDFLLSIAAEGGYQPLWSSAILEELLEHEARKLTARGSNPGDADKAATWLVQRMQNAFVGSEILGWEPLEGSFGLPDVDDEHVLAAAVVGGAGAIVTHNIKDFPAHLIPAGIEVLKPSEFLLNTISLDPSKGAAAVRQIASRSGRHGPTLADEDVLELLASRYELTEAVAPIRALLV